MGADDAVHDGQAEADAGVFVGAYAFRSALEGFGEGGYQLRGEPHAGVLDRQHASWAVRLVVTVTVPPAGRLWTMAFWTRFVTIRNRSAGEPLVGVAPPVTSSVMPALFGEGKQRFGGFFGDEGEVDASRG